MRRNGNLYWADLHIHSALSPCADNEMTPFSIVKQAKCRGLSIIALTDHNSVLNCPAIMHYSGPDLLIIPGMELQTKEEVHVICLFGTLQNASSWHQFVADHLEKKPNQVEYFGEQLIFDSADRICSSEPNLLLTSTCLGLKEVFDQIKQFHGYAFPAHVDRPSYSILANLGYLPQFFTLPVLEVSRQISPVQFREKYPDFKSPAIIQSSDAHRLLEIGQGRTQFCLPELSWTALTELLFQNS